MTQQQFRLAPKAHRDPANGILCPLELDVLFKLGKIAPGETVGATMLPGTYKGVEAMLTRRGWNLEVNAPYPGTVLDFTPADPTHASAHFPFNASDPFWLGMDYPAVFTDPATKKPAPLMQYNATYGAKGGWELGEGHTAIKGAVIDGVHTLRFTGYTLGTPAGKLTGSGNGTGILANWPGGTIAIEGVEVDNCDDGVRGPFRWYLERNCHFHRNGSGDGQSHNKYLDAEVVAIVGGNSHDAKVGHNTKLLSWLAILDGHDMLNVLPSMGDSYDGDFNGGLVVIKGGVQYDRPGDSNPGTMLHFNTVRRPLGPHGVFMAGVQQIADLQVRGAFLAIDNRAPALTNPYDYHKAPQLQNGDGSLVWTPVSVLIDGCEGRYRAGPLNYGFKNWAVNKSGVTIAKDQVSVNRLLPIDTTPARTSLDPDALSAAHPIAAKVARLAPADYTPALMDDLHAAMVAIRAGWHYPTVTA